MCLLNADYSLGEKYSADGMPGLVVVFPSGKAAIVKPEAASDEGGSDSAPPELRLRVQAMVDAGGAIPKSVVARADAAAVAEACAGASSWPSVLVGTCTGPTIELAPGSSSSAFSGAAALLLRTESAGAAAASSKPARRPLPSKLWPLPSSAYE